VTMYGLFVEHYQQYQTIWNGNGGRTYFYQNELPYDPAGAPFAQVVPWVFVRSAGTNTW
jgi:hypothetical protein